MGTNLQIEGCTFYLNGSPTYEGVTHEGRRIEGLLFNTRMVQAIFDDANPETATYWRYPDTGEWDPDRNTDEFCAMLPTYRAHGVLGVTVGLQGGGSIYEPEVYENYVNTAFRPDGTLKPAYCDRLARVLNAADDAGMVVIVNYFYWRQLDKLNGESAIRRAVDEATDWLLRSGHRNVLVDIMNEFHAGEGLLESEGIGDLIARVKQTTLHGRRLWVSSSVHPENLLPPGAWQARQDVYMPHGNDFWADDLRAELQAIKASPAFEANPRPILINEDSTYVESLEAAVDAYASWGFYSQGYGAGGWNHGRVAWPERDREETYEALSGFQTVPVNWSINTARKRAFFDRVAALTRNRDAEDAKSQS
jgi:hypothetical protein